MIGIRSTGIVAMALAVALAGIGSTALAKGHKQKGIGAQTAPAKGHKKQAGKKAEQTVRGTITAVTADSITLQTKKHGTQEFKLKAATVFERRQKKETTAASASDAATGMRARIEAKGQTAVKVTLKKAPKDGKQAKQAKHGKKAGGGRKGKHK